MLIAWLKEIDFLVACEPKARNLVASHPLVELNKLTTNLT